MYVNINVFIFSCLQANYSDLTVDFGGALCQVTNINYTSIVCNTTDQSEGNEEIKVVLWLNDQYLNLECVGNCTFNFTSDSTPRVTTVNPSEINSTSSNLELEGLKFGNNSSEVYVQVGDVECVILFSNDTFIECSLDNPLVGLQNINVLVYDVGHALLNKDEVTILPEIYSIFPSNGSLYGGAMITVIGAGFISDDIVVSIDSSKLSEKLSDIEVINRTQIICRLPALIYEGIADIIIVSNGIVYPKIQFSYTADFTPIILNVSHEVINNPSYVDTILLKGLYLTSDVNIFFGDYPCLENVYVNETLVMCTNLDLPAGKHNVSVYEEPYGYSNQDYVVEFIFAIETISPNRSK